MEQFEMRLNVESVKILNLLLNIFDERHDKVFAWLTTKNLKLGDVSPLMLINRGRGFRVLQFIEGVDHL